MADDAGVSELLYLVHELAVFKFLTVSLHIMCHFNWTIVIPTALQGLLHESLDSTWWLIFAASLALFSLDDRTGIVRQASRVVSIQ